MSDDLVKRLRVRAENLRMGLEGYTALDVDEAADRIEQLELVLRAICRTATDNATRNLAIKGLEGNCNCNEKTGE